MTDPSPGWESEHHLLYEVRSGGSWWPPHLCRMGSGSGCPVHPGAHLCDRPRGHQRPHHCPCCDRPWQMHGWTVW